MREEILRKFADKRQECEIWTRVMGYYRPVSEFNVGKKQEAWERHLYGETEAFGHNL